VPQINDPQQLFTQKLGAALTMEQTVLEMLQKNEQEAQDDGLKQQFSHHRQETQQQVQNLQQAFQALGEQPQNQPCPAIDGLKTEAEQMIQQTSPQLVDSVLLGGAAETEHHEIAVYEGLITKAEAMGQNEIVDLLQQNLEQEQHTLQEVKSKSEELAQQLAHGVTA
jgi:ferritin-like metal-binding protein YciE